MQTADWASGAMRRHCSPNVTSGFHACPLVRWPQIPHWQKKTCITSATEALGKYTKLKLSVFKLLFTFFNIYLIWHWKMFVVFVPFWKLFFSDDWFDQSEDFACNFANWSYIFVIVWSTVLCFQSARRPHGQTATGMKQLMYMDLRLIRNSFISSVKSQIVTAANAVVVCQYPKRCGSSQLFFVPHREVLLATNEREAPGVSASRRDPPLLEGPPSQSGRRGCRIREARGPQNSLFQRYTNKKKDHVLE